MSTTRTQSTIHIPTPLRGYTGGEAAVTVEGGTVGAALSALVARHPDLEPHLYDDAGNLRSFVNVFVGDEDIRHLDREATPLTGREEVSIVPSIAGGA